MDTIIQTCRGSLRGRSSDGVASFKGIPNAQPPFGANPTAGAPAGRALARRALRSLLDQSRPRWPIRQGLLWGGRMRAADQSVISLGDTGEVRALWWETSLNERNTEEFQLPERYCRKNRTTSA